MKNIIKKLNINTIKYYFLIIVIGLFISSPLLIGDMLKSHDGIYPISRTVGTATALSESSVPPLITSNFANGFGYSWNTFYPPFVTYCMLVIKVFSGSYVSALNILVVLSVCISGITMFKLVNELTGRKSISFLAALFYMAAPYRLTDIYVRMAIGEVVSFMFIPLVFLGLYNLFEKDRTKHWYITIGAVGLLLTHNISTLLTIITVFIYIVFNIKKIFKWDIFKKILLNILFILLIVAFFYIPLLEARNATEYAVFSEGKMGTSETVYEYTVYLFQLLFGKMQGGGGLPLSHNDNIVSDMGINIGLFLVVPLLFTPFVYSKVSKNKRGLYLLSVVTSILLIICITPIFRWDYLPDIVGIIQHPYRLLLIVTFILSILSAINIDLLMSNKLDLKTICVITILVLMYINPFINNMVSMNVGFSEYPFYETDEMEMGKDWSHSCAYYEYLPVNAEENLDYLASRNKGIVVLAGNMNIINETKSDGVYIGNVLKSDSDLTVIELPYIYYPGYRVTINDDVINYFETDNGFIGVEFKQSFEGEIKVVYTSTNITLIAWFISFVSIVIFVIVFLRSIIIKNKILKLN